METEKEVICAGCGAVINTNLEKYTHIEDFSCKKLEGESWWHVGCLGKAMNRDLTQLEKAAAMLVGKAIPIYDKLERELNDGKTEYAI